MGMGGLGAAGGEGKDGDGVVGGGAEGKQDGVVVGAGTGGGGGGRCGWRRIGGYDCERCWRTSESDVLHLGEESRARIRDREVARRAFGGHWLVAVAGIVGLWLFVLEEQEAARVLADGQAAPGNEVSFHLVDTPVIASAGVAAVAAVAEVVGQRQGRGR